MSNALLMPEVEAASDTAHFLAGGGEMGALMRAHDWSASPLGLTKSWPQSLRSVVSLMLTSKFPMFIAWGPELAFLYNDGYRPIFGDKHPHALGLPFRHVWSEIWQDIEPLVSKALAGEATFHENLHLVMQRHGYPEDTWYTFSYSPLRDDSGAIAGMFCACTETTGKVLADRRIAAEGERQRRMFERAPGFIAITVGPDHVFEFANAAYVRLVGGRELVGKSVREAFPEIEGQGFHEILARVYETGERFVAEQMPVRLRTAPGAEPEELFLDFIFEAIRDEGGKTTGIFVEGHNVTARARAVAALRKSEEEFRTLADGVSQFAWMADASGWIYWYNNRWYDYTGTTLEEMQGWGWRKVHHPDHVDRVVKRLQHSWDTGEIWEDTFPLRGKDGEYRWFLSRALPVRDQSGKILRWLGTNTDITERASAEAALRDSEERLRALADNLPNGMVYQAVREADGTVRFTYLSQAVERLHGLHADAVLADPSLLDAQVLPEFRPALEKVRREANADSKFISIEIPMRLPSGEVRWFHRASAPRRVPGGEILWDGVELDITERKRAEEAAHDSETRFAALFAQASAGLSETDLEGRFTAVNDRFCALIGWSREKLLAGMKIEEVTHPEDIARNLRLFRRAVETGEPFEMEKRYVRPDGSSVWVLNAVTALRNSAGRPASVFAVTTDVTDRKRAEEHQQLLINELNHRVKNTLTTVQSIASQTLRTAANKEEARKAFEDRLLALSRAHDVLTRENWEGATVRALVAQMVEPYANHAENRLHAEGPVLWLSPRAALALAMALQELATNAVKYGALSGDQGRITLTWRIDAQDPQRMHLRWEEQGGPPVTPPRRRGFGTRLIERGLAQDLDGAVEIAFEPGGVVCTIAAKIA